MKEKVKKIIFNLNYVFFMKNVIIFESNPDFCDNSRAVFDRMIELNLNDNYKMVWFVEDESKFKDLKIKNVSFIGEKHRTKRLFYEIFSKYIIDCNKYVRKRNKKQFRIYLTHGAYIKLPIDYSAISGDFDYVIQISDFFTQYNELLFNVNQKKIATTGYPRNDILLNQNNKYILFKNISRKKTICWIPTFRNHKNQIVATYDFPYGIPIVENEDELLQLNELLKQESILLVIKFHPAENIELICQKDLSNIKIVDDQLICKNHLTIYHYLTNIDAIITDYSSIYFDFLITDKPIGLAAPDIEHYKKYNNVVFDDYEEYLAGDFIYNFQDLKRFIKNVSKNKDISFNERMLKKNQFQKYLDNNSSDRVINLFRGKSGDIDEK